MQEIARLQEEAGSLPTIDVEGYSYDDDGNRVLMGGIELQFEPEEEDVYLYLPVIMRR